MGLKIRRAKKSDMIVLKKFRKEHFTESFPELMYKPGGDIKRLKKEISKSGAFVLTLGNEIIGYLYVDAGKYLGHQLGELHTIHIAKKYRGKGYSHLLMKKAMEYFKNKKVKEITLGTVISNKIAISLYHRYGFKDWRIRMKKMVK